MVKRTIAALAADGGVGVETVRYYQRRGLLSEPKRPIVGGVARGVRTYSDADVQRLNFVRRAQAAGFQLKEIKQLLAFEATDNRAAVRELTRARVAALDREIAELTTAREALAALAVACSGRSKGPCPILSAFD
ncbi:MAG: MerR family DNA-binding protein [Bradyrhizobium sp.]|nr:MerR family DNA-binding protein [Bradyrhizobium sp.]